MATKTKKPKQCERCGQQALLGERYCKECRKVVLREMKSSEYLETGGYGHKGQSRTSDMKENTLETKRGTGHG